MRLRVNVTLEGALSGAGMDSCGPFLIEGTYSPSSAQVVFSKTYSSHKVAYKGFWDGSQVVGVWSISTGWLQRGEFEIWPEQGEVSVTELMSESEVVL